MAEEDQADEFAEEGEGEGGAGKKKLFIIIGVVVLLLIGGTVPFLFMGGDDEAADGDETEQTAEAAVEEEGEKIPIFHAVPKAKEPGMVISLEPGTGFKRAQVSFRIFTYSPAVSEFLTANDPMIRHNLINTLTTSDNQKFLNKSGREELQKTLKKMLSDLLKNSKNEEEQMLADKIEDVYFNTFILQ
ncbi:MAG: flagellar basal body-associated FliL family protein [Gammaproteobacteria bacterium]|nr:flagellar basal body-associated FliL family protein [Gammaproteobacteria bacterium]